MDVKQLLEEFNEKLKKRIVISPETYDKWNIKKGLRNKDGTGVVVGVTDIGDVHGYIIDEGEKIPRHGRLRYRGIDINDLVDGFQKEKRFGFEETAYLLIFGELPNQEQLNEFMFFMAKARNLPENFKEDMILKMPSKSVMNKLARTVLNLYSIDDSPEDYSVENLLRQCMEIIARMPLIAAYAYQSKKHFYDNGSLIIHNNIERFSTAETFLHLIRPDGKFTPIEAEILDLCLVLHAEHGGGNNSTFTLRVISSSETDTYSAVAAAIGSLKGRKHGGANIEVKQMINDIRKNLKNFKDKNELKKYLIKIMNKEAGDGSGLVYGMGHAIYTLSDPRAVILREKAKELATKLNRLDDFMLYENIAELTPEVFKEVKGYENIMAANVDLYSGFVYDMLNIPEDLYTPLFAIARSAGWCAHRMEEIISSGKIIRPAYKSVAEPKKFIKLGDR